MEHEKLQQIIDNCKHPKARAFFETLFARHDELMESLNDRANGNIVDKIAGQYEKVVDFDEALRGVQWDEDEQLDELGPDVLDRYKDRANAQLRRGTAASKFTKPAVQAKKRQNRLQGVKRASSRLNTFHNSEYSDTTNEGVGSALGSLAQGIATQTVAHGLGVGAGTVSKFVGNLITKQKKYMAAQKPAKPMHTNPAQAASPKSVANMVLPSHVHGAIAKYPGPHEGHLNDFVNHHNAGVTAKEKGDKTLAAMHFRARDKALVRYTNIAPKAHLKHLNADKVQQMMSIKE